MASDQELYELNETFTENAVLYISKEREWFTTYGNDKSENDVHINSFRISHIPLAFCELVNYKCIWWLSHFKVQTSYLLGEKVNFNEASSKIFK